MAWKAFGWGTKKLRRAQISEGTPEGGETAIDRDSRQLPLLVHQSRYGGPKLASTFLKLILCMK